jgi:hypothetical protein
MPGRPLKDAGQRRRYNQPALGEWVDLPAEFELVLPAYPMPWYKADAKPWVVPKWIWDLWRSDSVTTQWAPGDVALALELGQDYYKLKAEHRLRIQTTLGLNAKGRRDLRWRNPVEAESAQKANQQAVEARRLRIVRERGGGDVAGTGDGA